MVSPSNPNVVQSFYGAFAALSNLVEHMAASPDGQTIVASAINLANNGTGSLIVFQNGNVVNTIPLLFTPNQAVFSPDGNTAYVWGDNCPYSPCPTSPLIYGTEVIDLQHGTSSFISALVPGDMSFTGSDASFFYELAPNAVTGVSLDSVLGSNTWFGVWYNADRSSCCNRRLAVIHSQFSDTFVVMQDNAVLFWDVARVPYVSGIINAAQPYQAGPVAPNQYIAIKGRNLDNLWTLSSSATLPTQLDTAQVLFQSSGQAGIPAPISFASPNQLNMLVPEGVYNRLRYAQDNRANHERRRLL